MTVQHTTSRTVSKKVIRTVATRTHFNESLLADDEDLKDRPIRLEGLLQLLPRNLRAKGCCALKISICISTDLSVYICVYTYMCKGMHICGTYILLYVCTDART